MCLISFVKDEPVDTEDNIDHQLEIVLAKPAWIEGEFIVHCSETGEN